MSFYAFDKSLSHNLENISKNILSNSGNNNSNSKNIDLDSYYSQSLAKDDEEKYNKWYNNYISQTFTSNSFNNLKIKDLYNNLINTYRNIINDLTSLFFPSQSEENKIFHSKNSIYQIILIYIRNLFDIFFSEERMLYVGISLCILSFFYYFIVVTK